MDQQDLKRRTRDFAIRIMNLVDALPHSAKGRAIANQLVRSGTAVGANYRACCRSRSKVEFIARMGVVEEEADESAFWLELIIKGRLMPAVKVEALLREANELVAIMAASRKSAALTTNRKSAIANRQ
jgi:four helix bundle protein